MMDDKQTDADVPDAPEGTETELYGEPVAEHVTETEAYQAFTTETNGSRIFVARFTREGDKWVKQGLDRHNVQDLFNTDGWPTN